MNNTMLLLVPKRRAMYTCQRIRCVIRKSIKDTHNRFKLLIMGLVTSLEYDDISAPPEVVVAWSILASKSCSYTDEEILRIIRNVSDTDLCSLIIHGLFFYDTENWAILDCDDVDILY